MEGINDWLWPVLAYPLNWILQTNIKGKTIKERFYNLKLDIAKTPRKNARLGYTHQQLINTRLRERFKASLRLVTNIREDAQDGHRRNATMRANITDNILASLVNLEHKVHSVFGHTFRDIERSRYDTPFAGVTVSHEPRVPKDLRALQHEITSPEQASFFEHDQDPSALQADFHFLMDVDTHITKFSPVNYVICTSNIAHFTS